MSARDHKFTVDEIIDASKGSGGVEALVDGKWVAAKPVHYEPLPWKLRRWLRAFRRLISVLRDGNSQKASER